MLARPSPKVCVRTRTEHAEGSRPSRRPRVPGAGKTAHGRGEPSILFGEKRESGGVPAVRAPRSAQRAAKGQNVVERGGDRIGLEALFHHGLHAGLEHSNLDREIGQALQASVLVAGSRIRHGGRNIREPPSGRKLTCTVSLQIARFYTVAGFRRVFRKACHSGRRSSATATPHTQVLALVRRFHMTSSGSATSRSSSRNASGD